MLCGEVASLCLLYFVAGLRTELSLPVSWNRPAVATLLVTECTAWKQSTARRLQPVCHLAPLPPWEAYHTGYFIR
uniref:8.3 kDa putative secretory protein n=1 Tax=Argas monolakensis TaxID=34602 RepID=Q09JG0_ARGMO|nr:8.3 kDa putative secretory protein [Argas monolakensis]